MFFYFRRKINLYEEYLMRVIINNDINEISIIDTNINKQDITL